MVKMAKRYGHIGQGAKRKALVALDEAGFQGDSPQNSPQSADDKADTLAN